MPEERKIYRAGRKNARPRRCRAPMRRSRPEGRSAAPTNAAAAAWCWACLLCLLVTLVASLVLTRCASEAEGPAQPDYGTPAAAWQKKTSSATTSTPAGRPSRRRCSREWMSPNSRVRSIGKPPKNAGIDFAIIRCGFGGEWDGQEEGWAQDDPPSGGATPMNVPGWASPLAPIFTPTPPRWRRPAARPTTLPACWA